MAHVSELHYSNAYSNASGVSEFLEVTLLPGEDPADFTVSFYQQNGRVGLEINLADPGVQVTTDPATGRSYYVISNDNFNVLLTDPNGGGSNNYEAYALTDVGAVPDDVISFQDIGGGTTNITAVNGLAAGETSTNIPVPTGPNAATYSIQFTAGDPTTPIYEAVTEGAAPPCFVSGTKIQTSDGEKAVEGLSVGDLVLGYDDNYLPLRRLLHRKVILRDLQRNPKFLPVRIMAGALGNGLPKRDLLVSQQHRMLVHSKIAARMFDDREVLIPAVKLAALPGIMIEDQVRSVDYFHLLFDAHEIVFAEGAPTESLFTGAEAMKSISPAAREEILAMFPELADLTYAPKPARPIPPGKLQKQLVARHMKNSKPLLGHI